MRSAAAPQDTIPRLWVWLAIGIVLRVILICLPLSVDDDSAVYLELGRNLLHHGTYGLAKGGIITPSLFRLPGYPIFLAFFGGKALLIKIVQSLLDLLGCVLLASAVRKELGSRAAEATLALSSICLFTATYAALELTESLSVFAISLGIYAFASWRTAIFADEPRRRFIILLAVASALAMLLRPDGALLTISLVFAILVTAFKKDRLKLALRDVAFFLALACIPFVIWTVRNAVDFHVFQPLAPRHVNDPGERVNLGFYRWLRTWSVEFSTTGDVFWNVGSEPIDLENISPRAFDSPEQRAQTEVLIEAYNRHKDLDADLDAKFNALALERIHAHPLRYYLIVPSLRVADMIFRPRTETFAIDVSFWRWKEHPEESAAAILLGLFNLPYFIVALVASLRRRVPFALLLATYFILRCVLLGSMENPEDRYSLEFYPILFVAAGSLFTKEKRYSVTQFSNSECSDIEAKQLVSG